MIRVRYNFTTEHYDLSLGTLAYELQDGKITVSLDDDEALNLIDQFKRCGVIVKDDSEYTRGLLEAQTKHLDDMRRLTMLENESGKIE